jgi:hypothetical protein
MTITGATQTISIVPPAIAINLNNPPLSLHAYSNAELLNPTVGQNYWNVTSGTLLYWNGTLCTAIGSGGGLTGCVTGNLVVAASISTACGSPTNIAATNVATQSGNNTLTGQNNLTAFNIDNALYVDGVKYTTPQAAINALPSGGGVVIVPVGTYAAPTSITTGTTLQCAAWMQCIFTSSSNLAYGSTNGSAYFTMNAWGIVWDFGGSSAGLTFNAMQQSSFNMACQNTTGDCLSIVSVTGSLNPWPSTSFANNTFNYYRATNVGEGLVLNGDVNLVGGCGGTQSASAGAVFLNQFKFVDIEGVTGANGIKLTSGVDSSDFDRVYVNLASGNTTGNGVLLGSRCPTTYGDIDLLHFGDVTVDATSPTSGYEVVEHYGRAVITNLIIGTNFTDSTSFSNNGYGEVQVGSVSGAQSASGGSNPSLTQTGDMFLYTPTAATSGSNPASPFWCMAANEWTGSASAQSKWCMQMLVTASGVPTSDELYFYNTGSSSTNQIGLVANQMRANHVVLTPTVVASLPAASGVKGALASVTDGSTTSDCTTGGGSDFVPCVSNGSAWAPFGSGAGGGGTVTSVATSAPLGGGTITTAGTLTCTTCVTASSPGAGIAHFAGSTQAVTSSAVNLANGDVTGQLPITKVGSAGLSGTAPLSAASTGVVSCLSCMYASSFASQADASTITWATGGAPNPNASVVLGGNRTLAVTGMVAGGVYWLNVIQPASGGPYTLTGGGPGTTGTCQASTWLIAGANTAEFPLGTTANEVDSVAWKYDGTNCYTIVTPNFGGLGPAFTQTIASGTASLSSVTLGTIDSGACSSAISVAATGVATTDTIGFTPNADPTGTTGYEPTAMLVIWPYPTSGHVNFKVCNTTGGNITPTTITLNWRVVR